MGPRITRLQKQVLAKMRSGYKATVPHKGRVANLYRLGQCNDYIPIYRTVVLALYRVGLIQVHEEDQHETDYVVTEGRPTPILEAFRGRPYAGPSYCGGDMTVDPQDCLEQALRHRRDEDYVAMRICLSMYQMWRRKGGFEPIMDDGSCGDDYLRSLMEDFMGGQLPS